MLTTATTVMSVSFDMDDLPIAQARTAGLAQNECYPQVLIDDPTFALLNTDPTVIANGAPNVALWAKAPTAALINGRTPPFRKRDLIDTYEYQFDTGNASRVPTEEERRAVANEMATVKAREDELRQLLMDAREQLGVEGEGDMTVPAKAEAQSTVTAVTSAETMMVDRVVQAPMPRITAAKPVMTVS